MLSRTTEYGLRAVVCMAGRPTERMTAEQIAVTAHLPVGYLSKVMQGLCRGGVVHSQRGPTGGFKLLKDPRELTVLEVIDAVEPIHRFHECPMATGRVGEELCPLHQRLDRAASLVEDCFRNAVVADLVICDPSDEPAAEATAGKAPSPPGAPSDSPQDAHAPKRKAKRKRRNKNNTGPNGVSS